MFSQVEVRLLVINRPKSAIAAAVGLRQGHMVRTYVLRVPAR